MMKNKITVHNKKRDKETELQQQAGDGPAVISLLHPHFSPQRQWNPDTAYTEKVINDYFNQKVKTKRLYTLQQI